jgi:WD40 repeat protein/serine/threonine protein kinase
MKENARNNSDKKEILPTASRLTPEEESIFSAPPPKIKGYHIISALGEGGFGIVYLAEQQKPVKRRVALKVLKPGMDSKQVIARFEAEEQALALLDHPNVARVYEAGMTEKGRSYFAMEYVKGVPITEYCDRNKLGIEDRLKVFLQVCDAIGHAHQKGIIHRDIKPSNILVFIESENVVPKVIDFGVAKAISQPLTERTLFTEQGQLIGTPEYMSPEQAEMVAQDIDTRTDIYSLGVLLYELLAGVLPFDPKTLRKEAFGEIQRIIREQDPPRPSTRLSSLGEEAKEVANSRRTEVGTLVRRLHKELEWIPLKAMRKERTHRYRSASELADDVQNYLNGVPLLAGPESAAYRVKKFVRRNRALVTGVVAVLVVLVAGIIVSTIFAIGQARERAVAEVAQVSEAQQRQVAEAEANRAKEESEARRRALYVNHIALADAAYREGNMRRVRELLEACPADLRGWEWYRLIHILDQSIMTLHGHRFRVNSISLNLDGKRIASGSADRSIKVWNWVTGKELMTISKAHENEITCVSFSPDGTRLVSSDGSGEIKVWDVTSGNKVMTLEGHNDWVFSTALSLDGKHIASTAYGNKMIKVWDMETGDKIMSLCGHEEDIYSVAFSPDSKLIVSGSSDRTIKVWDMAGGDEVMTMMGHHDGVSPVLFSPNGKLFASGSSDNTIKIWNATTGDELITLRGHDGPIESIAFSPDANYIVSGGMDNKIKVWNTATGEQTMNLCGHEGFVTSVLFTPDGNRIISGSWDGTIKVWDLTIDRELTKFLGHRSLIASIAFSPDGNRIVSRSEDGKVKVWDVASATEVMTLRGGRGIHLNSIAFSPDGRSIFSGSMDNTIKVWDAETGDEVETLHGHHGPVRAIAFSSDGKRVVSGSRDGEVKVWDVVRGEEMMTLAVGESSVLSVAFSPDGKRIVSGSWDGEVKVWDVESGSEVKILRGHSEVITSVVFSPDGKRIASACQEDGTVKIWDTATGLELLTFRGHGDLVSSVAFSPDGKRIISGSRDRTVRVLDVATGVELLTLRAYSGVTSVAFSPDGETIAAGTFGGAILLWESVAPAVVYELRKNTRTAQKLVDQLYEKHGLYHKVIDELNTDETLDEAVSKIALEIANSRRWLDSVSPEEITTQQEPTED